MPRPQKPQNSPSLSTPRLAAALLLAAALACLAGCGENVPKNLVTGKVTLEGKPVSGQVVFLAADGKEYTALITGAGGYSIANAPAGEARVMVRAVGGAAPQAAPPRDGGDVKMPPTTTPGGEQGAAPPAKYASPDTGLKVNVTGGKQTFDITLNP